MCQFSMCRINLFQNMATCGKVIRINSSYESRLFGNEIDKLIIRHNSRVSVININITLIL